MSLGTTLLGVGKTVGGRAIVRNGKKIAPAIASGGLRNTLANEGAIIKGLNNNFGKKVAKYSAVASAAAIPVGAGAAIASEHPLQKATNLAMDAAFYDPYLEQDYGIRGSDIDNNLIGRDIGFGEMLFNPLTEAKNYSMLFKPQEMGKAIENTLTANSNRDKSAKMMLDNFYNESDNVENIGRAKSPYWAGMYGMPYQPAVTRGPTYASGNMVMGMYNGRHGR